MKATGTTRPIDNLGRLVLPIELRRMFNLHSGDPVEVFVDDTYIMLKKYEPTCIFCGEAKDVQSFQGKLVCPHCLEEMRNMGREQ